MYIHNECTYNITIYIYIYVYIHIIFIYMLCIYIYMCIHTHIYIYIFICIPGKTKTTFSVRIGLDIFCVRYVLFPHTAMSGCKPSTCRSIVVLKSWICRTDSNRMSVSSRESIWGSMLTFAYCVFQHDVETILVLYRYIQIWWEMWQHLWPDLVPHHDSRFASLRAEIPLLETVRRCPNPVLSKDLNNP